MPIVAQGALICGTRDLHSLRVKELDRKTGFLINPSMEGSKHPCILIHPDHLWQGVAKEDSTRRLAPEGGQVLIF